MQHDTLTVLPADDKIEKLAETELVKHAALKALHKLHAQALVHKFTEDDYQKQLTAWKVKDYAEEPTAYGPNFFMRVDIGNGHYLHMRVHRQQNHDIYDFHSLHKTFHGDHETCCFPENVPLAFFNS